MSDQPEWPAGPHGAPGGYPPPPNAYVPPPGSPPATAYPVPPADQAAPFYPPGAYPWAATHQQPPAGPYFPPAPGPSPPAPPGPHWGQAPGPRRHVAAVAVGLSVVVALGAGVLIGALTAPSARRPVVASPPTTASVPSRIAPAGPSRLGSTFRLGFGDGRQTGQMTVKLDRVIDPARAQSLFSPAAGQRYIGLQFTIEDLSAAPLDDDINLDTSVTGSDGRAYEPAYILLDGCSNFAAGAYQLRQGHSATGCSAFQLPAGVTVSEVTFTPAGGITGDASARWRVSEP